MRMNSESFKFSLWKVKDDCCRYEFTYAIIFTEESESVKCVERDNDRCNDKL